MKRESNYEHFIFEDISEFVCSLKQNCICYTCEEAQIMRIDIKKSKGAMYNLARTIDRQRDIILCGIRMCWFKKCLLTQKYMQVSRCLLYYQIL